MFNVFLIGISGGSCSGKTTFAKKLAQILSDQNNDLEICIISEDDFYHDRKTLPHIDFYDGIYDDPIIRDHDLLLQKLKLISGGKQVEIPQYDFVNHRRSNVLKLIEPVEIIIIEGLHLFCNEDLSEMLDYKVFIDLDDETRFARRLKRDTIERGRTKESVYLQYGGVRRAYDKFIEPIKHRADTKTSGNFNDAILHNISAAIQLQINQKKSHL